MRILLLTSSDICACINLNLLLDRLSCEHEISVMISNYEFVNERESEIAHRKMYFEKDYVRQELFPKIEQNKVQYTKENKPKYLTFKTLSEYYSIDFIEIDKGNARAEIFQHAKDFKPDIIFCCRFEYILKDEVLALPTYGSYNIHSGLLPECAGPDATFWAMHNNWEFSGCTLHLINEYVDQGKIYARLKFPLDYTKGVIANRVKAYEFGITAFFSLVEQIRRQEEIIYQQSDLSIHCYYHSPNEDDLKKLYTPLFFEKEAKSFYEIIQSF